MNRSTWAAASAVTMILGACKGGGSHSHAPGGTARDAVLATDHDLEGKLVIRDPRTDAANGARTLTLTLENTSSDKLSVRCTVDWYDHEGKRLTLQPGGWAEVAIDPKGSRAVEFHAMPPEARSWRLRFQRG
jgi:uncharacterized protein YcfL